MTLPGTAAALAVTIDGVAVPAQEGASLFECAEAAGVRVPTSCVKQGKCRECLVEVEEGAFLLTAPARGLSLRCPRNWRDPGCWVPGYSCCREPDSDTHGHGDTLVGNSGGAAGHSARFN